MDKEKGRKIISLITLFGVQAGDTPGVRPDAGVLRAAFYERSSEANEPTSQVVRAPGRGQANLGFAGSVTYKLCPRKLI